MKNQIISVFFIALSFTACKETRVEEEETRRFVFDYPQPIDDSELDHFPSRFKGVYLASDSTYLKINDNTIITERISTFPFAKTKLDSLKDEAVYENGKLIFKDGSVFTTVEKGDSIYAYHTSADTVFRLSANEKLKRINGRLVMSYKDSIFWRSSVLSLEKDSLKWQYLFNIEDIPQLQEIVKDINVDDSTNIRINPTRKEFRKILEQKQLGSKIGYKKIK